MNRIRETRPAPRYGLLWAFVRRMLLLYAAWAVCRVIFYLMNASIIGPVGLNELPHLLRGSLAFDTASILYVNAPFILLSLLPFRFRERKGYQRMLLWLYSTVQRYRACDQPLGRHLFPLCPKAFHRRRAVVPGQQRQHGHGRAESHGRELVRRAAGRRADLRVWSGATGGSLRCRRDGKAGGIFWSIWAYWPPESR